MATASIAAAAATAALDDVLRELGALTWPTAAAALAASSSGWSRVDDPERDDGRPAYVHSATNQLYRWQERGWFEANARRDRALAANNYEATRWHGAHLTRAELKSELRKARAAYRAALLPTCPLATLPLRVGSPRACSRAGA